MTLTNRPLYLVTDRTGLTDDTFFERLELACQAGVDLVQLREKTLASGDYFRLAQRVKMITDRYDLPLLIDDRLDIAQAVDAAGVHVGQSDLPVAVVRQILGPDKLIGATTKTIAQADRAVREGADYLGVGAIFPTTTHVKTVRTSVDTLAEIKARVPIPVYAIGGLKASNVAAVQPAHVDGVAVVSAIMQAEDTIAATEALRTAVLKVL
ncbi:thiamine phosphate synthase [Secundilactobacillus paracollinoides]|uniref:Thiamine-phosphate synthase n=1 Tax=Secundilactobacillus paracollinoides TaxID=240427 RepID=A0A1B2IVZ1_9LACO|nr:thiamine phosphate synthase [Secundilactobacillus paracollinoides]ANZ60362.1 thiamine phosphate synthase [Secundilactobacillus paracollinoides]ANZ62649.1 thiamine phosphate synthase [Secundilactobacillus paracollinoides]ANZ66191.1 thiamine phosphate synthase [Secundilactobacillus paracollinoides]KRL75066.1 thiamine-phosphate diphosphorylase [Secundilactobacillus paracollinoides DSM 15502 = JCM 11969]